MRDNEGVSSKVGLFERLQLERAERVRAAPAPLMLLLLLLLLLICSSASSKLMQSTLVLASFVLLGLLGSR